MVGDRGAGRCRVVRIGANDAPSAAVSKRMDGDASGPSYPEGAGYAIGLVLGAVVGALAWAVSRSVVLGVILLAATGTALGVAIEQALHTRPLTPRERRIALGSVLLGLVVLAVVYVVVVG